MVYKRKKYYRGDTHLKRRWRTRSRKKDLDEIDADIQPDKADELLHQDVDFDKPGSAQHYCLHCARYFINEQALSDHFRTKVHKRRLKALEVEPYSIEESERAAGLGCWKVAPKRKIETQKPLADASEISSSALYITGDKAQNTFAVLTPYIDFDERLRTGKLDILKNIEARRLSIDLSKIEKRWNFFRMIDDHKNILEFTKTEIGNTIKQSATTDLDKLKLHFKLVKNDLKNVKEFSYGIEENAAISVLNLPNILHQRTPIDGHDFIVHSFLNKPEHRSESHLKIGTENDLIQFSNSMFYFLKSDAALFELEISNYFRNSLLNSWGYTQLSNADFVRSIVVEGCGTNYLDNQKILTLEDVVSAGKCHELSRLHLVGGASLYSFMAYFTKHIVQQHYFPLKYFACGRNYRPPIAIDKSAKSLFNVSQESVLKLFTATLDDADEFLDNIIREIIKLYEPLGYHFQLVYRPADQLLHSETLRLSIQMYSNYLQHYVEVGNISMYDEYLSKRLLFTCKINNNNNNERKFPKVIAGKLLNVQRFLGCALENNSITPNKLLLSNLSADKQ